MSMNNLFLHTIISYFISEFCQASTPLRMSRGVLKTKRYFGKKSNVDTNIYFEEYLKAVSRSNYKNSAQNLFKTKMSR